MKGHRGFSGMAGLPGPAVSDRVKSSKKKSHSAQAERLNKPAEIFF